MLLQVQPHMGKAFEGIQSVRFDSNNAIIDAMKSPEGELVAESARAHSYILSKQVRKTC